MLVSFLSPFKPTLKMDANLANVLIVNHGSGLEFSPSETRSSQLPLEGSEGNSRTASRDARLFQSLAEWISLLLCIKLRNLGGPKLHQCPTMDGRDPAIPLQIPTNNGLSWFQSGAGFCPSTV